MDANSRKEEGRRTSGSKAEVSVIDFNTLEKIAIFFSWSGIHSWIRGLSREPRETAGGTLSKTESQTQTRVLKC